MLATKEPFVEAGADDPTFNDDARHYVSVEATFAFTDYLGVTVAFRDVFPSAVVPGGTEEGQRRTDAEAETTPPDVPYVGRSLTALFVGFGSLVVATMLGSVPAPSPSPPASTSAADGAPGITKTLPVPPVTFDSRAGALTFDARSKDGDICLRAADSATRRPRTTVRLRAILLLRERELDRCGGLAWRGHDWSTRHPSAVVGIEAEGPVPGLAAPHPIPRMAHREDGFRRSANPRGA